MRFCATYWFAFSLCLFSIHLRLEGGFLQNIQQPLQTIFFTYFLGLFSIVVGYFEIWLLFAGARAFWVHTLNADMVICINQRKSAQP